MQLSLAPVQSALRAPTLLKWLRATGADLINAHVSAPVLRGVLAGQSGDHGLPPSQVGPLGLTPRTEFSGLYLCGQSTLSHGVAGVTESGVEAAKAVLNCRTRDILTDKGLGPLFLQAEEQARGRTI